MSDENRPGGMPQFGKAEYESTGSNRCRTCEQPIAGQYYRVSGAMTCAACAEKAAGQLPKDTHKAFGRGMLFGVGGAILGLVLYSTVGIVTGLMIGYVSLAVGYIVGKAIMMGSWGIGGRRYQIAAVALTYAAVSLSAIPISIAYFIQEEKEKAAAKQAAGLADPAQPADSSPAEAEKTDEPAEAEQEMSLGAMLGWLLLVGLASPFLALEDLFSGLIGLVILFVGVNIAWRLTATRELEVLGPFQS